MMKTILSNLKSMNKKLIASYVVMFIILGLIVLWQPQDIYHVFLLIYTLMCMLIINTHDIQYQLDKLYKDKAQQDFNNLNITMLMQNISNQVDKIVEATDKVKSSTEQCEKAMKKIDSQLQQWIQKNNNIKN